MKHEGRRMGHKSVCSKELYGIHCPQCCRVEEKIKSARAAVVEAAKKLKEARGRWCIASQYGTAALNKSSDTDLVLAMKYVCDKVKALERLEKEMEV